MENILSRYRNLTILVAVLFAQVLGLAVQVQRPGDGGSVSLLRSWVVGGITPVQKAFVHTQDWLADTFREYFYLRNVRAENRRLREQLDRARIENVRLAESVQEARRLQAMLDFTDRFIGQTVAARVIGSSGSEASRVIYIDKGARHGIDTDMAVITPEGVVGKIASVFPTTAQVLLINDQSSGLGAMFQAGRLQGVVRGVHGGHLALLYIMKDEEVKVGDLLVASGGDRIFPKGFPVGTVAQVSPGDVFYDIRLKPAAPLSRLEEVLVVVRMAEEKPVAVGERPLRAADIMMDRLPSVPPRKEKEPPARPARPAAPVQPAETAAAGQAPAAAREGGATPPPARPAQTSPEIVTPAAEARTETAPPALPQPSAGSEPATSPQPRPPSPEDTPR